LNQGGDIMIPQSFLDAIEAFKKVGINQEQFKLIQQNAEVLSEFSEQAKILTEKAFSIGTIIQEETYPKLKFPEKTQIPDPLLLDIIELNKQIKEINSILVTIKIGIVEIKTAQKYSIWIIGLLIATIFPMGLGIIWKLFDLAKLIS